MIEFYGRSFISINSVHLVGFGMGAHLAGGAAFTVRQKTDNLKRVYRITGLDPAFQAFYPGFFRHLSREDALFVDVIHTDAWGAGVPVSTGTVDFWPNGGGATQPGCELDVLGTRDGDSCSHRRAWRYWAETVTVGIDQSTQSFFAIKCNTYFGFTINRCSQSAVTNMGLGVSFK